MRFYAPIAKVDGEQRMVWGYASTDAVDDQGETITRDALTAALADYLKFANIREMHQMSAVGVAEEAAIDGKGLYVGARIVDPHAWDKVRAGVYKGFSVGGQVTARDPADRSVITALRLTEISLVDRPANPEAVFDCWKAERAEDLAKRETAEGPPIDYADPAYQPDGRKRYPLDGEAHIRAAWSLIHMPGNAAAYTEGELEQIKARIAAAWQRMIDPAGPPAASAGKAAGAADEQAVLDDLHDRLDALTDGDCCKAAQTMGRHSKIRLGHLKTAHDALCRAGARCNSAGAAPQADDRDDGFAADADKAARADDLLKAFAGAVMPRLDALSRRIEEIAATPLPPLTVARGAAVIAKHEDAGGGASPDDVVAALARMSGEERTLALIKAAHQSPIRLPGPLRRT